MSVQIKPGGKIALIVIFVAFLIFGFTWWKKQPHAVAASQTVGTVAIPDVAEAALTGSAAIELPFPSTTEALNGGLKIVHQEMAWQSQNSWAYANGGPRTTKGSLFDKAHLDMQIVRQDDCSQSCADMVKYINDYKNGVTKDGFLITFMGSGIPAYITGIAEAVKNLGPEYAPVAFLTTGKSYGEDQIIVSSPDYVKNPQLLKGAVLRGVRLDGDIDLALKFCGDNGIKVNPNETTYDKDALNLSYAKDYLQAVVDYNNNQKETRHIVENGKTTGKDTTVGFDAVATWTPGDVNAAQGRGGATLISTKKYASVMPNITITCKKFLNDNRSQIEDMIAALAQAGDQLRTFDDVKKFTSNLVAQIYNEQNATMAINGKTYRGADYWYNAYNGINYNTNLHLGGSMVYNLPDMAKEFGLNNSSDVYKEIYNTFGTLQSKLYPTEAVFKTGYLPYTKAVDKSYINDVIANHPELLEGKALTTQFADKITDTVANKSVQINFETGSAVISQNSYALLNDIYSSALTSGLKLGIYGYTDNTGNPSNNQQLSEARANAVKVYLISKGLPSSEVESAGYGEANPIGDNNTTTGRAKNRRVQIVLGQ